MFKIKGRVFAMAILAVAAAVDIAINESYARLPLYFIKNEGQLDAKVRLYEKGPGHETYFTDEGIYLSFVKRDKPHLPAASVNLSFINANKDPEIIALNEQAGKINYFIGSDPSRWRSNIPTFAAVFYKEVWPGIDIKFYGNNQKLEYDVIIRSGANPDVVKFSCDGIEGQRVLENGDLEIILNEGSVIQKMPYIYQYIDGKKKEIEGSFVVESSTHDTQRFFYSFAIASFDKTKPLIIDPVLVYSTYLAGSGGDGGYGIATDTAGNTYVTGYTYSTNFPTKDPIQEVQGGGEDAFVLKLNPGGTALVYSTYFGGSGDDYGRGIAVDASGNAYVTGYTYSKNFPTKGPIQGAKRGFDDAFILKLNPDGTALLYSTYLGGGDHEGGRGIAVDSSGNAYVTGWTSSTNFPTKGPIQGTKGGAEDAFALKLNPGGTALVFSTYLGGSNDDSGYGIAVDPSGNAYVTGWTSSTNFPAKDPIQGAKGGAEDAFVLKLNPGGTALVFSTYLGGNGGDYGYGIAVDSSGNAYVTGETSSTNFPTKDPFQGAKGDAEDAFVLKLNPGGRSLVYSTYLGGSGGDYGYGIAVDFNGNAYITGWTSSTNFPTKDPIQETNEGFDDAFVTKLNPGGTALLYSTYLGGSDWEWGYSIAVDSSGNTYATGWTTSVNFPTKEPIQKTRGGVNDAYIAKIYAIHTPPKSDSEKILLARLCGGCHSLEISGTCVTGNCSSSSIPLKKTTPREWERFIPWIRDGFDCPINPAEMKALTNYLNNRFPPPEKEYLFTWDEVYKIKGAWNVVSLSALDGYLYAGVEGGKAGIYRSMNGSIWNQVAGTEVNALYGLLKFKGAYYAGGNEPEAQIFRSKDGHSWERVATLAGYDGVISLGVFHNILFAGTTWGAIYRSDNGTSWEHVSQFPDHGEPNWIRSFIEFKGRFYAIAEKGDIYRTTETGDGKVWQEVSWLPEDHKETRLLRPAAVFRDNLYIGTISHGEVWMTSDGVTWEMAFDVTPDRDTGYIGSLKATEDRLWAGINIGFGSGRVYMTADGEKWEEVGLLSPHTIEALEYFRGSLYAGILSPPDTSIYKGNEPPKNSLDRLDIKGGK